MATATRVAGDEEDEGVEEGNDDEEGNLLLFPERKF
jgi:hypothetical protein